MHTIFHENEGTVDSVAIQLLNNTSQLFTYASLIYNKTLLYVSKNCCKYKRSPFGHD